MSAVADGTLDQSVETQLEAAGIASTVSVFQMPKVVKPQPPTPSPAPQQLGVSDASTGSGTYISNKPRSTSDIVVSKKMPIGEILHLQATGWLWPVALRQQTIHFFNDVAFVASTAFQQVVPDTQTYHTV